MAVDYQDLRDFIAQVDAIGDLKRISGAAAEYEIGGITEVAAGLASPAVGVVADGSSAPTR